MRWNSGNLVGHSYVGGENVVIIEDVITGGTSFKETKPVLKSNNVNVIGLVVGVDRQEKGSGELSAANEVAKLYDASFKSIVDLDWIVNRLKNEVFLGQNWLNDEILDSISKYRSVYGA